MAIHSFGDKETREFFVTGQPPKKAGWLNVASIAKRKLDMVQYASELNDLRSPPGNRLEALRGDLRGFYSIRINDQWRVIFRWNNRRAEDVRIMDYHG
jgi:proteic killer suppression protein